MLQDQPKGQPRDQPRPRLRDALTGEVLVDGHGRRVPSCGPYLVRLPPPLPAGDERAIPLRLHSSQEAKDGLLGAKQWSRAFWRYLRDVLPRRLAEADREDLVEWWNVPYGVERVKRGFRDRYPDRPDYAEDAARAAICALRDAESIPEILAETGRSDGWLAYQCELAHRFAYRRSTT